MSISIVSNVAANIGVAATSAGTAAINALPVDFAALLSAQTLSTAKSALLGPSVEISSKSDSTAALAENTEKSSDEMLDPSIFASMFGIPQLPPANTQVQGTAKFASETTEKKASLDTLSDQTTLMSESRDSRTANKEIANLSTVLREIDHQLPSVANEAANIAADLTSGTGANFETAMANASLPQEKAVTKQATISTPMTSSSWPAQFSEKIVWLAKSDQQSAQININPPQLGPVQITLNLNGDQANAIFASPHAEVRQAIEAAMPQLREMLASAGISLGDASVGSNSSQQSQQQPTPSANKNQLRDENAILPANEKATSTGSGQILQRGRGLVDLFA